MGSLILTMKLQGPLLLVLVVSLAEKLSGAALPSPLDGINIHLHFGDEVDDKIPHNRQLGRPYATGLLPEGEQEQVYEVKERVLDRAETPLIETDAGVYYASDDIVIKKKEKQKAGEDKEVDGDEHEDGAERTKKTN